MCVQCLQEFKQEIDLMAKNVEGDPLIPAARTVLELMASGPVEYARVMKMLAIYLAEYPGAEEQLTGDLHHLRDGFRKQGAIAVPIEDAHGPVLAQFNPKVSH